METLSLPANISVARARLPQTYEAAKTALANCANIDECIDWANKADALASYAKQAEDESLHQMATRIRARAVRRCGELLKQYDKGDGRPRKNGEGDHPVSQRQAAKSVGFSRHQEKQAVRVANIPAADFEDEVDGDERVTISKLASMGKRSRPAPTDHLQGRDPEQFAAATHTVSAMRRFAEKCAEHDAAYIAGGVLPNEVAEARRIVAAIDGWLDRFVVSLKG